MFVDTTALHKHIGVHGTEIFKCDYPGCERSFATTMQLRRHRTMHDKREEKEAAKAAAAAEPARAEAEAEAETAPPSTDPITDDNTDKAANDSDSMQVDASKE